MNIKFDIQTIILMIAGAGLVFGVLIFSGIIPLGKGQSSNTSQGVTGNVLIWGTLDELKMQRILANAQAQLAGVSISYEEKDPDSYEQDLLNALASGNGPDLFMVDNTNIIQHKDKIFVIPYENYPKTVFETNYIAQAQLFLSPEGVLAFPVIIDPMVLYYNKDLLSSAFIVQPPQYWDELPALVNDLTLQSDSGVISQSLIGLGTYQNITHAKDILALMMLQSENPLVAYMGKDQKLTSTLLFDGALDSTFRFFSSFSNPALETYTWNNARPNDTRAFLSEESALYIGFASELESLRNQNPNLNFDIALMLQQRNNPLRITGGKVSGFAVSKVSQNLPGAFTVGNYLASPDISTQISNALLLPPVSNQYLSASMAEPYLEVMRKSAIIARGWLDPYNEETDKLFRAFVEDSISGRARVSDAIRSLDAGMKRLLDSSL